MLQIKLTRRLAHFTVQTDLALESAFTALFGHSGAGKTSTLNMIAGFLKPDAGEIILDGRTLYSHSKGITLKPRQRNLGYIFQESRLFPHLSVRENLLFGFRRVSRAERKFDFEEIVAVSGLKRHLQQTPQSLSGGEKQRVALARAVLASPAYLLMDEPLGALDQAARLAFLNFLRDIHHRFSLPILYVTHDLSSVLNFADQVVVLKSGKVLGYGAPHALLDKMTGAPLVNREDVANLLEAEIMSHDDASGVTHVRVGELNLVLPRLSAPVSAKVLLNLPASEIILAVQEPGGLSASNILRGKITEIHHVGERVLVGVTAGARFTVEIVEATVKRLELVVGREVYLIFKASSFRRLN